MNTWTNYLLKFALLVLCIGHIRSLDTGETVYNGNFIVLESLSNWNYRQENEPLYANQPLQSDKPEFFLVSEENNFDLHFKSNLTASSFEALDKCTDLKAFYSFDYYLDLNPKLKVLDWSLSFFDEKQTFEGELKKWSAHGKRLEFGITEFKKRLAAVNNEVFKMRIQTADRYKLDDLNSELKFAIKNLQLSFSCMASRVVFRFKHELSANPSTPFSFEKNGHLQSREQQFQYWSNRVFPAFLKGSVDKYYYTDRPSSKLNFIITEFNFEKEEEVCLTFDYFVTKGAFLSVNFMNIIKRNQTLIRLYTSEVDERLINVDAIRGRTKLQWHNATVCVKGEQIMGDKKRPVPQFSFEAFVDKPELKADIVAVTNFRVSRRIQNDLRNYLPNWKLNGERALHDWHTVPQISNFRLDLTEDRQLKLHLRELPADSKRTYYVISDWFILNPNQNYLTFKVNSNLTDYQLKLKVQLDPIGDVDSKTWSLSSAMEEQPMRFDFKNVRKYLQFDSEFKTRVLFEIFNNKPILSNQKVGKKAESSSKTSKQTGEQLFTISEIQLADKCTDELICNNRGRCQSTGANNATCGCHTGWHGDMCEYENMCEQKLKNIDSEKTGNEFCKQKDRKCLPNKNLFTCECKDDEFWDSEILECAAVNNCLFQTCGLNEHCKLRAGEAKCECKETFKRREGGVCLKDLCSDPNKKCPKNQLCMHVENEVDPICYCPQGFFRRETDNVCVDNRYLPLRFGERPFGSEVSPFVLQKHNCQQDYKIDDNGQVTCTCLPGYQEIENGRCRETFPLSSCKCNDNEICVKRLDNKNQEQFECACKAGFFGDNCAENICDSNKAEAFCGTGSNSPHSCQITADKKFVCNCDQHLYALGKDGLCAFKDVCSEKSVTCGQHATCFNQLTKSPGQSYFETTPWCGCKHGLTGSLDSSSCMDPCLKDPHQCDHVQFSRCRLIGEMNEIKCACIPGMWRKGLMDPCTPSKSAIQMEVIFISKDTNVNPVHKKDQSPPRMRYLNLDGSPFNLTSRIENLRKRLRAARSVFRLSPGTMYPIGLPRLAAPLARKQEKPAKEEPPKEQPAKEEPPKEEPPKKYTGPHHFSITSMKNPCAHDLDLEGCIRRWNAAYQSINRLPEGPQGERFVESMIRKSLLDTFNIVFGKNSIDSVAVIGFEPINELDVENFGLKTYYNVRFVLHSNTVDLQPDNVKNALLKKCSRQSTNPDNEELYLTCAIENQSILVLTNLDLEEYDVCERDVLKCHEFNECYSRRKREPDNFNFEKDQVAFECRCRQGFKSIYAPAPHYSHFVNHTCEDINECESPDLYNCDPISTYCFNTIGSFECRCQKGYKPSNETHCIELCSDSQCKNGDCKPSNDHEDFCQCYDDWKGPNCDQQNTKLAGFRTGIIVTVVVAVIILVLMVLGFIFYGKSYTQKRVDSRTATLRRELELSRVDNQRVPRQSDERHVKHHTIAEGVATTTYRSGDNGQSSGNENPAFDKS